MASQHDLNEAMVLNLLRIRECLKLEQVVALLPQLSWNQVFQCVDSLSRRGEIILHRRGFDYEIVRASPKPDSTPCSV
jgi:hypothetical protein